MSEANSSLNLIWECVKCEGKRTRGKHVIRQSEKISTRSDMSICNVIEGKMPDLFAEEGE